MEVIVTGIMGQTIDRTTYNSRKANLGSVVKPGNLFVEEVAGQSLRRSGISIQLVIQCYTICILDV